MVERLLAQATANRDEAGGDKRARMDALRGVAAGELARRAHAAPRGSIHSRIGHQQLDRSDAALDGILRPGNAGSENTGADQAGAVGLALRGLPASCVAEEIPVRDDLAELDRVHRAQAHVEQRIEDAKAHGLSKLPFASPAPGPVRPTSPPSANASTSYPSTLGGPKKTQAHPASIRLSSTSCS